MNKRKVIIIILAIMLATIAAVVIVHKSVFETIKHYTLYDGTKVTKIMRWGGGGNLIYIVQNYQGKKQYRDKVVFKPGIIARVDGVDCLMQEADFNKSQGLGIVKGIRYIIYSKNKEIKHAERDKNSDGVIDEKLYFKDNLVNKAEISSKRNGIFDVIEYYDDGKLIKSMYDSNGDGKPDKEGKPPVDEMYKITHKMGEAR